MPRTWFCWILWPQKIFVTPQIQSRSNQSNLPHWMLLVRIWPAWALITDLSHWSAFTISTIVSKLAIDHWPEPQYQKGCARSVRSGIKYDWSHMSWLFASNYANHLLEDVQTFVIILGTQTMCYFRHEVIALVCMYMSDTRKDWHFFSYFLQVSYAIGVAEPLSLTVFHFGTSSKTEKELLQIVNNNFDLRPGKIVKWVQLPLFWTVFENPLSIQWMLIRF